MKAINGIRVALYVIVIVGVVLNLITRERVAGFIWSIALLIVSIMTITQLVMGRGRRGKQ